MTETATVTATENPVGVLEQEAATGGSIAAVVLSRGSNSWGSNSRGSNDAGAGEEAPSSSALVGLTRLAEEARDYIGGSKAANTLRAYQADWKDFSDWCSWQGREALPASAETVALYLTDIARELKTSTMQRRLASINQAHAMKGISPSPTKDALVRSVWQGIRRSKGAAMQGKAPVLTADIRVMVDHLPEGKLLGVRDRALLLIGFAGAMRRSELVGLDTGDVVQTGDGLVVTIRRSKTDQEGQGRKVGIPYGSRPQTCPVRGMQAWLSASGIESGPLFRRVDRHGNLREGRLGDRAVALVVKRALEAAGKDATGFAGHSLRAGLATSAAMAGVSERVIQEQTGHKSLVILRRYIREGSLFRENAAAQVGL